MEETSPPMPVAPGDILAGKYEVERVLGRGGMGIVVAARHKDLGELFAIKLLLPKALEDPQAVDRFVREARAAARLKGEHVAKVTDVGRLDNGSPYMVMEHLSGIDLRKHVRASGPLPLDQAITHVLQACDAIAEAHALGIIHRDLKPANLFLTRRANGTSCVKVLDFGISKQIAQDDVHLTKTGEILGTPLYMAPEQMARMKNADARCDIWSMGIVLYELLTGTTPFHARSLTEVIASVLQDDPPPPSQARPELPAAIDAILIKCLQKRADNRFQSIEEFAAALRAAGAPDEVANPSRPSIAEPLRLVESSTISSPSITSMPVPDLPSPELTMARVSTPSALPYAPTANTGSAWGATEHLRPKRSGGILLAVGGTMAVALAALGIWLAVRSPPTDPASNSSGLASAATAIITPADLATKVEAAAAALPAASASTTARASSSAAPGKSTGKKKPAPPPPQPTDKFGGIR